MRRGRPRPCKGCCFRHERSHCSTSACSDSTVTSELGSASVALGAAGLLDLLALDLREAVGLAVAELSGAAAAAEEEEDEEDEEEEESSSVTSCSLCASSSSSSAPD